MKPPNQAVGPYTYELAEATLPVGDRRIFRAGALNPIARP